MVGMKQSTYSVSFCIKRGFANLEIREIRFLLCFLCLRMQMKRDCYRTTICLLKKSIPESLLIWLRRGAFLFCQALKSHPGGLSFHHGSLTGLWRATEWSSDLTTTSAPGTMMRVELITNHRQRSCIM